MATIAGQLSPESARIAEVSMIGAIAQWCECMHGQNPLLKSIEFLVTAVEAEIGAVSRFSRDSRSLGRVVAFDRAAPDVRGGRIEKSYARQLMGVYFDVARPGSLWSRSMLEEVPAPDLADFHTARHLREMAVIPLDSNPQFIDILELHFSEKLRPLQQHVLSTLAPVLSRTWQNRAQGLFTEALLRQMPRADRTCTAPILSTENPAKLSRAEFRVGLLLGRGLTPELIREDLGIRESTLRSHLGNLYAKTDSANLSELVFRLTSADPYRQPTARHA